MTYYQILGVKNTASDQEIKEAYKTLMKKYHPDVYKGDKSFAERKAKDINQAYDVLSDPKSRSAYDEEISPTPKYEYTPPKYDSDYFYRNTNNYTSNYNTSSYNTYYTNRTTSSTYKKVNEMHNNFSNNIISTVSKLKLIQKLILFFTILLIYLLLLLFSFNQYNKISSGDLSGTLFNNNNSQELDYSDYDYDDYQYLTRDEFNIESFISNEKLREIYEKSEYKNRYTFSEFKKMVEDYLYEYYYY